MRKFIVSDLHGNGEVYNSIMGYLDNIALTEKVQLYINGDLIDRGIDSFTMLVDVYRRVYGQGKVKIKYLAGNHELMMWQAIRNKAPGENVRAWCNWMCNGGWVIEGELNSVANSKYLYNKFFKFIGNLDIYHAFQEKVLEDKILLVHAQAPKRIKKVCDMKLSDNNRTVEKAVWNRRETKGEKRVYLGKDGYLTIIGHTPVNKKNGFIFDKEDNVFNIDGGCGTYANGIFSYESVPLVEIKDGYIKLIIFNHNNEIVDGYIYDGDMFSMCTRDIEIERAFIDHQYDDCRERQQQLIKKRQEII